MPYKDYWNLFYLFIIREKYVDTSNDPIEYQVTDPSNTSQTISFKPYFSILPSVISTPLSWSQSELHEIKGTNLYDAVHTIRRSLEESYMTLVPSLCLRYPNYFDSNIFTLDNFIWAYQVFWSRALSIEAPWLTGQHLEFLQSRHFLSNEEQSEETINSNVTPNDSVTRIAALVPIIDMLNHNHNSKITFFTGNT